VIPGAAIYGYTFCTDGFEPVQGYELSACEDHPQYRFWLTPCWVRVGDVARLRKWTVTEWDTGCAVGKAYDTPEEAATAAAVYLSLITPDKMREAYLKMMAHVEHVLLAPGAPDVVYATAVHEHKEDYYDADIPF
jgi:hypothetical protein